MLKAELRTAVRFAFKGINLSNRMSFVVQEYFDRIMFKKIGVHFSNELKDFDIACFSLIAFELDKLEQKELKNKNKKSR